MKLLKTLLTIIITIILIVFIVGLFLPRNYQIEETITINKPDSIVFENVADLNAYAKWNPWSGAEPEAEKKAINKPGYQGSTLYWKGKNIGEGQLEITRVILNIRIEETVTFIKPFASSAESIFQFQPVPEGTKVIWRTEGENKGALQRWMMTFYKGTLINDYKKGLLNLKAYCEQE
jgi:hypothetical protein